jgi:hypothetical protein
MRLNNKTISNKSLDLITYKIIDTYVMIFKEYISMINESKHCCNSNNLITTMFIGMNAIHRVFEYILIKTKNIEKVCYYSKKAFYYYLEYMEQVYSSNLHQNLNQMDAILFVYKKTIFDLYNGDNDDTFCTMTNIITSNGEIMIIDDTNLQIILKKISICMNTFFYWENMEINISFYDRKELCSHYLDIFIKKCFCNKQIIPFLEIMQKKILMKYQDYLLLLKELFELNERKKNCSDIEINEWTLNKFYFLKYDFEKKINEKNIKNLVKWVFA